MGAGWHVLHKDVFPELCLETSFIQRKQINITNYNPNSNKHSFNVIVFQS